ncbi:unnamed protein product [Leptidea sinapis]|uniref:Uncharacterized protein n=1 Tax=Leptidea sinapis TaxID=189913 RepID=A0A5E4QUX7_9NEOP|nr:unnamed protein product [Leptidea sinapis]
MVYLVGVGRPQQRRREPARQHVLVDAHDGARPPRQQPPEEGGARGQHGRVHGHLARAEPVRAARRARARAAPRQPRVARLACAHLTITRGHGCGARGRRATYRCPAAGQQDGAVRRQREARAAQLHVWGEARVAQARQVGGQRARGLAGQRRLRVQVAQRGQRLQLLAQHHHLGRPPRRHHGAQEARVLAAALGPGVPRAPRGRREPPPQRAQSGAARLLLPLPGTRDEYVPYNVGHGGRGSAHSSVARVADLQHTHTLYCTHYRRSTPLSNKHLLPLERGAHVVPRAAHTQTAQQPAHPPPPPPAAITCPDLEHSGDMPLTGRWTQNCPELLVKFDLHDTVKPCETKQILFLSEIFQVKLVSCDVNNTLNNITVENSDFSACSIDKYHPPLEINFEHNFRNADYEVINRELAEIKWEILFSSFDNQYAIMKQKIVRAPLHSYYTEEKWSPTPSTSGIQNTHTISRTTSEVLYSVSDIWYDFHLTKMTQYLTKIMIYQKFVKKSYSLMVLPLKLILYHNQAKSFS